MLSPVVHLRRFTRDELRHRLKPLFRIGFSRYSSDAVYDSCRASLPRLNDLAEIHLRRSSAKCTESFFCFIERWKLNDISVDFVKPYTRSQPRPRSGAGFRCP